VEELEGISSPSQSLLADDTSIFIMKAIDRACSDAYWSASHAHAVAVPNILRLLNVMVLSVSFFCASSPFGQGFSYGG